MLVETDKAESVAADARARSTASPRAVVPTGAGASVDGQTRRRASIPDEETVNSKSVAGGPRRRPRSRTDTDGVIGVTGLGAAQIDFLHAVYGNFPLMLLIIAVLTYILLVRAFRSLLLPLKAVILNLVSLAATSTALMVLFWQDGLRLERGLRHRTRPARSRSGSR